MSEIDTYDESQLAEFPTKKGFRQRGMEMTRLETFTDAAFAFAVISLTLIFVVLIYVYPLKATYSGALEFFSNGYLESFFGLSTFDDVRTLFFVFGTGYAALSATIVLLYRHALSVADRLSLNELERFDSTTEFSFWNINAVVAIISVVLSQTLPDRLVFISGMFYSVFGIVLPWYRIRRSRLRKALVVDSTPSATGEQSS